MNASTILAIRPGVSSDACWAARPTGIYGVLAACALLLPSVIWILLVLSGSAKGAALRAEHRKAMQAAWYDQFTQEEKDRLAKTDPEKKGLWSWSVIPSISAALAEPWGQWTMLWSSVLVYPFSIVCFDDPQVWGMLWVSAAAFFGLSKFSWRVAPHYVLTAIMSVIVGPAIFLLASLFLLPQNESAAVALLSIALVDGVAFLSFPAASHRFVKTAARANALETGFPLVEVTVVCVLVSILMLITN